MSKMYTKVVIFFYTEKTSVKFTQKKYFKKLKSKKQLLI